MFVGSELLTIITNYTIMKSNYRRSHYTAIHLHRIKPKGQNVDFIQLSQNKPKLCLFENNE